MFDRYAIAHIGKGHQTFKRMVAVRLHLTDVQEQVDLGRSQNRQNRFAHDAVQSSTAASDTGTVTRPRRSCSLASTSVRRLSSTSSVRTRSHWKPASR